MGSNTTNFNLYKPGDSDFVNQVTDLNDNYDKIDTALKTNLDGIGANSSQITSLQGRVSSLETLVVGSSSSNFATFNKFTSSISLSLGYTLIPPMSTTSSPEVPSDTFVMGRIILKVLNIVSSANVRKINLQIVAADGGTAVSDATVVAEGPGTVLARNLASDPIIYQFPAHSAGNTAKLDISFMSVPAFGSTPYKGFQLLAGIVSGGGAAYNDMSLLQGYFKLDS